MDCGSSMILMKQTNETSSKQNPRRSKKRKRNLPGRKERLRRKIKELKESKIQSHLVTKRKSAGNSLNSMCPTIKRLVQCTYRWLYHNMNTPIRIGLGIELAST